MRNEEKRWDSLSLNDAYAGGDLRPKDRLFATLDVTVHEGRMPNQLKTLFVDTVGFISDIPTALIASFGATLEDAALADVLLHVRDVSHPDSEAQAANVVDTLRALGVPEALIANMITVGNKIDKVEPALWKETFSSSGYLPVSATEGFGLEALRRRLEDEVMRQTGRTTVKIR